MFHREGYILKDYYGGTEEILVQNDSLIIFPVELYTQLGNIERYHHTDYKEVNFSIERVSWYESTKWLKIKPDGSEGYVVQKVDVERERFFDGEEIMRLHYAENRKFEDLRKQLF